MSPDFWLTDGNVVAALIGAAAALVFTALRDWWVARTRLKNVASAFVWELRFLDRKLRADLRLSQ